jgi:hypothetical protein
MTDPGRAAAGSLLAAPPPHGRGARPTCSRPQAGHARRDGHGHAPSSARDLHQRHARRELEIRPKLQKAALAEIRRLEALMTTWRRGQRAVSRQRGGGEAPSTVIAVGTRDASTVIEKSLWMSQRSEGVFDISFEAMHGLWKFDRGSRSETIPAAAAVSAARKLIDYRKIKLDAAKSTVFLEKAGTRINLGGIAKGYASTRRRACSRARGMKSFFVQAGGDLSSRGKKPDGSAFAWVCATRGAGPTTTSPDRAVEDHAFSTAGDYERASSRRQALPPHHRSAHRLPGDREPQRDDVGEGRLHRGRDRRRGVHPRAREGARPRGVDRRRGRGHRRRLVAAPSDGP